MDQEQKPSPAVGIIVAIALIGLVAGGVLLTRSDSGTSSSVQTTATTAPQSTANSNVSKVSTSTKPSAQAKSNSYKDGTYTASTSYSTPESRNDLNVKLTVSSGVITDAVVTADYSDRESRQYVEAFLSGYKSAVVGKDLGSLSLSRVSGSSLTTGGFNKALEMVKQDAATS